MRKHIRGAPVLAAALAVALVLAGHAGHAQVAGGADVNLSQKTGDDTECAIAKNPSDKLQLFSLCNTGGPGLAAARSTDGGITWTSPDPTDGTIADGDPGQGPAACCDPTLAWDTFGNLFITYIDAGVGNIVTIVSTDGGATFTNLASFPGSVDQPTVVAANTTAPGVPVAVWIVWNQNGEMVARGAAVTGLGAVGTFNALQTIPGTAGCSFGDVAIAPDGTVVQACQNPVGGQGPATIFVNTDADGLGPGNFGAAVAATTTNVGGFDFIPAQNARSVDAESGLAYDANSASAHFGRLYMVYTDETANENNDTDVMVRFSDNNGATWSAPIRVNDDPAAPIRSQFLPRIASNRLSGNVSVCWHDARNSATNTAMQEFCTIATPTGASPSFMTNVAISDGSSTSNSSGVEFGDYAGLAYFQGLAHPIWADASNSTGNNPNGTANFDAFSDRVTGGIAASEGDPHITTVTRVHYDFQAAGDFVALRSSDGLEIQTRHTPVATTFTPGADPYDGIATNVSVNTAVAARVGSHRVTFQPNVSGIPDPSGLQLRIDGTLTRLGPNGVDLGDGGRVARTPVGNGIQIDFPNGTILIIIPGWWASQGKWYLNVDVFQTPATEGIMGALARGSWLPALPDGTSMGPMPPTVAQRYAELYQRFANAWRVTPRTSLFDYDDSALAGCNLAGWPRERPACVPRPRPAPRIPMAVAQMLCAPVADRNTRRDCVFDVTATGDRGFARTYLLTRQVRLGATVIQVSGDRSWSAPGDSVRFTATVTPTAGRAVEVPRGTVQFTIDGDRAGTAVSLDRRGLATLWTTLRRPGTHRVSATYTPDRRSSFLASSSVARIHTVQQQTSR